MNRKNYKNLKYKPHSKIKVRKRKMNYYRFINLPRSRHYFPNDNPEIYLECVSSIRRFIISKLQERPYEEKELFEELNNYNSSLALALDYIFYEVEEGDSEKFKRALDIITSGIEVRSDGNKNYWGLTSKLDRV